MLFTEITSGSHWNIMVFTRQQQGGYWVLYEPAVPGTVGPYVWVPSYRRARTLADSLSLALNPNVFCVRRRDSDGTYHVYLATG